MKLLVCLNYRIPEFTATDEQIDKLKVKCPELEIIHCKTQEDFVKNLSKANLVMTFSFSKIWLPFTYGLKWLATPAAGFDVLGCDLPSRIFVTHGKFHGKIMAPSLLNMILAVNRGFMLGLTPQKTLLGTKAMILGYGNIGREIGKLLKVHGIEVFGITQKNKDEIDELLPQIDHLVLTLPANDSTDNIINSEKLKLMKKTASIYNLGRGNAIDEFALFDALENEKIHAAVLDVQKEEPYPENGILRQTKNCFIYPHISAAAPDYLDFFFDEWFETYQTLKNEARI